MNFEDGDLKGLRGWLHGENVACIVAMAWAVPFVQRGLLRKGHTSTWAGFTRLVSLAYLPILLYV